MEIKEFILLLNPRLFKVGERIKVFHKGKWHRGTVDHFCPWRWTESKRLFKVLHEINPNKCIMVNEDAPTGKVTYDDYNHAYMFMKLDEKIGEDTDLLNGYGLRSNRGGYDIIHENEEEYDPPSHVFMAGKNKEK